MLIIISVGFLTTLLLLYYQKKSIEDKINNSIIEQGNDFFSKMDFLFNRIFQNKEDAHKQTVSAIEPLSKFLEVMRNKIEEMERSRISRESLLNNNISNLMKLQEEVKLSTEILKNETVRMVNSLKKPNVRGKWGEMQLKRIAEITGMLPFCEFEVQYEVNDVRPDMVVKLPNGGCVFIDSKAPLDAYLEMIDSHNEEKFKKENAKAIRNHIYTLSNKKYWSNDISPELVIMFIPLEGIWLSALDDDPKIMEYATEKNVIISTPMTLIGLLKTIFYGWNQVHIAREAEELKKGIAIVSQSLKEISGLMSSSLKSLQTSGKNMENSLELIIQCSKSIDAKVLHNNHNNAQDLLKNNSENI